MEELIEIAEGDKGIERRRSARAPDYPMPVTARGGLREIPAGLGAIHAPSTAPPAARTRVFAHDGRSPNLRTSITSTTGSLF